jgi:flagellar motor switch protein FliG
MVRNTDPVQLLNFIQTEHPQTISLIMAHLQPPQASQILGALPESIQAEVAKRLALMDRTSPEVIREVERVLEKKLSMVAGEDYTAVGGVDSVVAILNQVDRGTEKSIMENLEIQNPELAEEIKRKMFVFEDINSLDDRSMQRVLKEIDNKVLSVALKGTTEVLREKFFRNMSKRAATMLSEEMEYMGPVRLKDVDESQQKIVNIIRDLEDRGEVFLSRGGEEEFVR